MDGRGTYSANNPIRPIIRNNGHDRASRYMSIGFWSDRSEAADSSDSKTLIQSWAKDKPFFALGLILQPE